MKKAKSVISLCLTIVACYLIALLINKLVFFGVVVEGKSMDPTLQENEFGLSDKVFYKVFGIDRFDVIVFDYNDELLVKRVIGLPNERIAYHDNHLYVNDELVAEDFIDDSVRADTCTPMAIIHNRDFCSSTGFVLGEDEYFVMGDNRADSFDSRYFTKMVTKEDIVSKGLIIYGTMKCESNVEECTQRDYKWLRFVGW